MGDYTMKKTIIIIVILCLLLLCGCVNYPLYDHYGVWESEDPRMRIDMTGGDASVFGYDGILIKEDGSVIPIVYQDIHGQFGIYEYKGEDLRGATETELYSGTFKVRKNTLILKTRDGKEIVLKKVSSEKPNTESSSVQ